MDSSGTEKSVANYRYDNIELCDTRIGGGIAVEKRLWLQKQLSNLSRQVDTTRDGIRHHRGISQGDVADPLGPLMCQFFPTDLRSNSSCVPTPTPTPIESRLGILQSFLQRSFRLRIPRATAYSGRLNFRYPCGLDLSSGSCLR